MFTKFPLLVSPSECIGQLKWTYFQTRQSKPVGRLHNFDQATWGLWRSFTFLFPLQLRKSAILTSFGAALAILSPGFEPFTHQVLRAYPKPILLFNTLGLWAQVTYLLIFRTSKMSISPASLCLDKKFLTGYVAGLECPHLFGSITSIK